MIARMLQRLTASTALVAALSCSGVASADAAGDAKVLFDEGAKAFAERRYADAAEAYERSARVSPHPAPLVNAAEAWTLDGNPVRAARACDEALRLSLTASLRADLEERLARLERTIATIAVDGDGRRALRVDDAYELRPPAVLRVSPGKHVLAVVGGPPSSSRPETVQLVAGERRHVVLAVDDGAAAGAAPPPADATPAVDTHTGARVPLGTWIALGAGVAAGAAAATFGVMTLGAKDDFDANPTTANADAFERDRLVTNVLVGVTAAAVLTAGAFFLFTPRRTTRDGAVHASARGLTITFD